MIATGIGSMPGVDYAESVRIVTGETPDLVAMPELPGRGVHAGMIGRSLAILEGLGADIVPAGWRLTDLPGIDHRRARSLLAQDLDVLEEHLQGFEAGLKIQVAGPWTLASAVELPRGERVLADPGARRDLAESLAEGLRRHLADVRRRVPAARYVVQVDEPALPSVLAGAVRTASGLHRYRSIDPPEADAALRRVVEAITETGARPVVHSCAAELPVALLRGAGFEAISFDLGLTRAEDVWSEAFEAGVDLWPGAVGVADQGPGAPDRVAQQLVDFFSRLGFGEQAFVDRAVVTPACGLAGFSPPASLRALAVATGVGRLF